MSALPIDPYHDAIQRVLAKSSDISVMPQVVFKIMEMSSDENTSTAKLEQTILVDPGFSARILTQANSAAFGLPRKVTSIREAIGFLGFARVKQLATNVGVFDMFLGKTDADSLRRRSWWRLSLNSAHVARDLASKLGVGVGDEAYSSTLLHLLGKTLLSRFDAAVYQDVEKLIKDGECDWLAERIVYGCDHIMVGLAAAEIWGLPASVRETLDYVTPREPDCASAVMCALVALSDSLAKACAEPPIPHKVPVWAATLLKVDEAAYTNLVPHSQTVISSITNLS